MDAECNKILIGHVTRRNMQFSLIWPTFKEQIHPTKWYYFKISLFLLSYVALLLSTLMHLVVIIKKKIDLHISEDIAVLTSMSGIWYMATIYVRNQPKIAALLRDLSNFKSFGKPPGFDELNKKLNSWSWVAFMYPTLGSTTYSMIKLSQKSECEQMNSEKNLNEKCGLMYPFWIPFDINHFPVFHLIFLYTWLSTLLFVRLHLSIFYQALEIAQHIILRIKHLSCMFEHIFEHSNKQTSRLKFVNCIKYHQVILEMSVRLDHCFSRLMFVHFIMTASICGCLEKQFVDGVYPVTAAVHLLGWILSLFIASFSGQNIIDASEYFIDTVWRSKWYKSHLQKDVIFVLAKSQKGLRMNVGSFGVLSYEFFVGVLKMSYSVLAMLTS